MAGESWEAAEDNQSTRILQEVCGIVHPILVALSSTSRVGDLSGRDGDLSGHVGDLSGHVGYASGSDSILKYGGLGLADILKLVLQSCTSWLRASLPPWAMLDMLVVLRVF